MSVLETTYRGPRIASESPLPYLPGALTAAVQPPANAPPFRRIVGWLDDALMLVLIWLMVPAVIIAVGTPIALLVWAVIEVARRFGVPL